MSVQTTYGYATARGIAGGIYDSYHYPVDSRFNEEENGKLGFGLGVVQGSIPGSNITLPVEASTAAVFEGVTVNGFSTQQDLEGVTTLFKGQNVGVMRRGRIWVQLVADEAPAYGGELHLIVSGADAGKFATSGGVTIAGRFIGKADNGLAPVELFGTDSAAASSASGASTTSAETSGT